MSRKYLEELGIDINNNTPWDRKRKYKMKYIKQRMKYGFDERETWSLDNTMNLLLYERLCRYKELAENMIDLDFHTFEFKGETLTQRQCIDRMIEGLKLDLTLDMYDTIREDDEQIKEKIGDVWKLYDLCRNVLWW